MNMRGCLAVAAATVGMLCFAATAKAQVMADRVPADALVYIGWTRPDTLGADYDASHLKAFVEALKLPQFVGTHFNENAAATPGNPIAQDAQLLRKALEDMAKAPTVLYFNGLDVPGVALPVGTQAVPHFSIFSKIGKQKADALAEKLDALFQRNNRPEIGLHKVVAVGEYLLMYVGDDSMVARLTGPAPADSLDKTENFRKAIAQIDAGDKSTVVVYVDGEAFAQSAAKFINALPNAPIQARHMYPAIAEGLGINGIKQLAWAGNFDGANWKSSGILGMAQQRHGLLGFVDNGPLSDASMHLIPKSATSAGAFRFDGVRLLADVRETAAAIDPAYPAQLETLLKQAYAWTGVDFTKELLPSLGDEFVYYGSPDAAGNSLLGFTLVNRLKNPKLAESALTAAEDFTNLLILQRDPNSKLQFHAEPLPAPFEKVTAHKLVTENMTPIWAIYDGTLFVSLSSQGLQAALQMAGTDGAKKPSILDNEQFLALRKKVGRDAFASFSYVDLQKTLPESYQLLSRALTRQLANAANPKEIYALPPLENILPPTGPALKVFWTDDAGRHMKETGPFPGADFLSPASFLILRLTELAQLQARRVGGPPAPGSNLP